MSSKIDFSGSKVQLLVKNNKFNINILKDSNDNVLEAIELSSNNVNITNNLNVNNDISLAGNLFCPSRFIIDPHVYNDNSGTVVIKGNLEVLGTKTIINSSQLDVSDINIVLAKNYSNVDQISNAGIKITNNDIATLLYNNNKWNSNISFLISGDLDICGGKINNYILDSSLTKIFRDISINDNSINLILSDISRIDSYIVKDVSFIQLKTDVSNLEASLNSLNLSNLTNDISYVTDLSFIQLKTDVSNLEASLNSLNLSNLTNDISYVTDLSFIQLKTDVSNLEASLNSLNLSNLTNDISYVTDLSFTQLKTDVSNLEASLNIIDISYVKDVSFTQLEEDICTNRINILNNTQDINIIKSNNITTENIQSHIDYTMDFSVPQSYNVFTAKTHTDLNSYLLTTYDQWINASTYGYSIDVRPLNKFSFILLKFKINFIAFNIISFRIIRTIGNYSSLLFQDLSLCYNVNNIIKNIYDVTFLDTDFSNIMFSNNNNNIQNINYSVHFYLSNNIQTSNLDISLGILGYDDNNYNTIIAQELFNYNTEESKFIRYPSISNQESYLLNNVLTKEPNKLIDISNDGYKITIHPTSNRSKIMIQYKINYLCNVESEQKISFELHRTFLENSDSSLIFNDLSLGSELGLFTRNIYTGTFIDSPYFDNQITYYFKFMITDSNYLGLNISCGIIGFPESYNSIIAQELYLPPQ